jgi:hypothetical protein
MKYQTMKIYGGAEVQLRTFWTPTLDGNEWSLLRPAPIEQEAR